MDFKTEKFFADGFAKGIRIFLSHNTVNAKDLLKKARS